MRDRSDECNAFSPDFLARFARREPHPATPEADFAGPWRVVELPGDGESRFACIASGGRRALLTFEEPDLAYLGAAALAVTERPARFRLQADAEGTVHVILDGRPVGTAALLGDTLPLDLSRFADLRVRPGALAHLLLSVPDGVLRRVGVLLDEMAGAAGPHPTTPTAGPHPKEVGR